MREFLRTLLDRQIVEALLVPVEGANHSVMPALVKNATRLDHADPFAPVMAFNSARLLSMLARENTGTKIGAVLRSCEIRALIELAKFNQVKLDQVTIIGVDCFGTFSTPDYAATLAGAPDISSQVMAHARDGKPNGFAMRSACAMCEHPTPSHADISIGFIGVDNTQMLAIDVRDDLAEKLGIAVDDSYAKARENVLNELIAKRTAQRDATLNQFHAQIKQGGIANYFAECLECTNCRTACPICYCKECFFQTANAERSSRELMRMIERRGELAMPPDALLFQMTRLNHMATSCVGCGMCEAACPHDIPLTAMFRSVGARVQKIFEYEPGRDLNEKPPFMTFKQNELLEIGEER